MSIPLSMTSYCSSVKWDIIRFVIMSIPGAESLLSDIACCKSAFKKVLFKYWLSWCVSLSTIFLSNTLSIFYSSSFHRLYSLLFSFAVFLDISAKWLAKISATSWGLVAGKLFVPDQRDGVEVRVNFPLILFIFL